MRWGGGGQSKGEQSMLESTSQRLTHFRLPIRREHVASALQAQVDRVVHLKSRRHLLRPICDSSQNFLLARLVEGFVAQPWPFTNDCILIPMEG